MVETLNQEEQKSFVEDVINNVPRIVLMKKLGLSHGAYEYYREKLSIAINQEKVLAEAKIKSNFNLSENRRLLSQIFKNIEELVEFKKTICDRELYDKVVLEIENLSIIYAESLAYNKPIVVPPRLKELDNEQNTDFSI